jgi:hypothetical protein
MPNQATGTALPEDSFPQSEQIQDRGAAVAVLAGRLDAAERCGRGRTKRRRIFDLDKLGNSSGELADRPGLS